MTKKGYKSVLVKERHHKYLTEKCKELGKSMREYLGEIIEKEIEAL